MSNWKFQTKAIKNKGWVREGVIDNLLQVSSEWCGGGVAEKAWRGAKGGAKGVPGKFRQQGNKEIG